MVAVDQLHLSQGPNHQVEKFQEGSSSLIWSVGIFSACGTTRRNSKN